MLEQAQLVGLAGAAAAALVAEMTKESWASMRCLAARLFRRGGPEEEERQLARLDADQVQAATLDQAALRERWNRRLLTLVEDFPEAAEELAAMARRKPQEPQSGVNQTAENNTGSVIQIGRDNSGSLNTERR
ncbi:hypothetical protein PH213_40930 [Streptomyces sp. SRF1]|uniref:hypothetical protein n=1 Tax=Streptomyces sp. SRF1 TaxID=1549642 RepID=UPI0025B046D5|nr:hypothetical protein [Streptomyces sp. SRF1]MDN3060770.1 hypothetical protein [Streptomyces sp. SRF1]